MSVVDQLQNQSWNRRMYDACKSTDDLRLSTGPGRYQLDAPPKYCNATFAPEPTIRQQKWGASMNNSFIKTDVESDLFNLNRPLTDCPSGKYHPNADNCYSTQGEPAGQGVVCNNQSCKGVNGGQYSNKPYPTACPTVEGFTDRAPQDRFRKSGQRCQDNNLVDMPACHFGVEDTRLSNPPSTLRGTGVNRFQSLCFNPQEKIFFPGSYQNSTRLIVKDNHRACIPDLTTMFTPLVTDDGKNIPCPQTVPTCGANTNFMYAYDRCG